MPKMRDRLRPSHAPATGPGPTAALAPPDVPPEPPSIAEGYDSLDWVLTPAGGITTAFPDGAHPPPTPGVRVGVRVRVRVRVSNPGPLPPVGLSDPNMRFSAF